MEKKKEENLLGNLLSQCVVESKCECCGTISKRVGIIMGERYTGSEKPSVYDVSFDLKRPSSASCCQSFLAKDVKII